MGTVTSAVFRRDDKKNSKDEEYIKYCKENMSSETFYDFIRLVNLFGIPSSKPNMMMCKTRQLSDLLELLTGYNQVLSDFVQKQIFEMMQTPHSITDLCQAEEY